MILMRPVESITPGESITPEKEIDTNFSLEGTEWVSKQNLENKSYENVTEYSLKFHSFNQPDAKTIMPIYEPIGISGKEKCNTFSCNYTPYINNRIEIGEIMKTEVHCELSIQWTSLLDNVTNYRVIEQTNKWESRELVLSGPNVEIVLVEIVKGYLSKNKLEGNFPIITIGDEIVVPMFLLNDEPNIRYDEPNIRYDEPNIRMVNLHPSENQNSIYMSGPLAVCTVFKQEPEIVYGRPIYQNKKQVLGDIFIDKTKTTSWYYPLDEQIRSSIITMSEPEKHKFRTHWLEVAQHEHSSIASFSQVIMELLTYGAPSRLIELTQQAMADEIKHTKIAMTLASTTHTPPVIYNITPLNLQPRIRTLEQFLQDNYRDAIINEAKSAKDLQKQANETKVEGLKKLLIEISKDEQRHADLGHLIETSFTTVI